MNNVEFIETEKAILSEIERLKTQLQEARTSYIEANKQFAIGEKVKVTTSEMKHHFSDKGYPEKIDYAFVSGYEIHYFGDRGVRPTLKKCTVKGAMSQHGFYLHNNMKIEKI